MDPDGTLHFVQLDSEQTPLEEAVSTPAMVKAARHRIVTVFTACILAACSTAPGGQSAAPSVAAQSTDAPSGLPASTPTATPTRPIGRSEPALVFGCEGALCVVRPDGSDRQRLPINANGDLGEPAWSPDGEQIVFVVKDAATPNGSLWTANADGSGAEVLYDGGGDCEYGTHGPSWSPDGTRIALTCIDSDGVAEVSVLDLATRARTTLEKFKYPHEAGGPITWSPDGATLAFAPDTWDPTDTFIAESTIATMPAAGGKVTRLTEPILFGAHPDWSPDGSLIVFNTYDTGQFFGADKASNIYLVKPDGTGLHQLTTTSTGGDLRLGQPFWSIDGTRIWVSVLRETTARNSLAWVDSTTGELHELEAVEGKRFRERPLP